MSLFGFLYRCFRKIGSDYVSRKFWLQDNMSLVCETRMVAFVFNSGSATVWNEETNTISPTQPQRQRPQKMISNVLNSGTAVVDDLITPKRLPMQPSLWQCNQLLLR